MLQQVTNVSAGNQANVGSSKLLVYCAGLMAFVPSLMGMQTSVTLSLCTGKNSKRDKTSDTKATVKTSNRKKKKLRDSDEDYVDGDSTAGKKSVPGEEGTTPITKFFSSATFTKTGESKKGITPSGKDLSTPFADSEAAGTLCA